MSPREPELPILTRAESEVMAVLWARGEGTVRDVVEGLPRTVAYTTALTILRILEQKGYLVHAPHPEGGRAHVYRPAVPETVARTQHARDLVDRLFGGRAGALVTGLLDSEDVSRADLEALRAQIDARLKPGGKPGRGK